jgi:hypothetical protein
MTFGSLAIDQPRLHGDWPLSWGKCNSPCITLRRASGMLCPGRMSRHVRSGPKLTRRRQPIRWSTRQPNSPSHYWEILLGQYVFVKGASFTQLFFATLLKRNVMCVKRHYLFMQN